MDTLVLANIKQRPTRALASTLGISVGVVLIVVTVGLARGMLKNAGERESNVGAELLFQPPGSFGVGATTSPLSLPVPYAAAISEVDGVRAATPVGRYVRSGAGGLGFERIEGVVFESEPTMASYPEITGIEIVEGRAPAGPNKDAEIIVDRRRVEDHGAGVGSTIELLGRELTIVGVYGPEVGSRIKMRLDSMQRLLGSENKASWILIKTSNPEVQEAVAASIEERFPGNQIIYTRDIPSFFEKGLPSLTVFLNVVIGLSTVISALIVLLAMYTAVTERTREIGILKSLGASKKFIVSVVEKEALLISAFGALMGLILAVVARAFITELTPLLVEFELHWVMAATFIALLGGGLGALYPALHAANQDPVKALSYE
jgi:putative ABC transport system permease protein